MTSPSDATPSRIADERISIALLIGAGAVVCALLATRLTYVPLWDGRIYAACITAVADHLGFGSLRCGGHTSQAYMAVTGLAQKLAQSSPVPVLITNAALFLIAVVGFHRLVRLVFPRAAGVDRALLTAVFSLQPAFLASVVQPGLDLPLLPAFMWAIVFMLERRFGAAILAGIALAFTKETGVLLYAVLLVCHVCCYEFRRVGSAGDRIGRVLRFAPAAIPGIVYLGYLLYRTTLPNTAVMWYGGTTNDSLVRQFLVPRLDLYQVNYAVLLLVLNFAWIITAVVGADAFIGTVRAAHRESRRAVSEADPRALGFLVLLAIATGYALTRFTTYGHTRYFITVTALLLVLFYASLVRLTIGLQARRALLGLYALLLMVSTTRTVDPVSRRLYGTFRFGTRDLLRMTRVTGECCGTGQDQLVYNLQFTAFHTLVDEVLASVSAEDSTVIVVPDSMAWILIGPVDSTSHRRTLARRGVFTPKVTEPRYLLTDRIPPNVVQYIALPNGDDRRARAQLDQLYSTSRVRRFGAAGYALEAYEFSGLRSDSTR